MNTPGFSAEASLYRTSETYVVTAGRGAKLGVIPQDLIPPDWNEFCTGCQELFWGLGLQTCCTRTPFGWICWRRFCDIPR